MIKYVKLLSGEDFIAKSLPNEDTLTHFCFKNGLGLAQSQQGVGLREFLPFSDGEKFEVLKTAVVIQTDAMEQLKAQYNQMFGELIVPNNGGGIILG